MSTGNGCACLGRMVDWSAVVSGESAGGEGEGEGRGSAAGLGYTKPLAAPPPPTLSEALVHKQRLCL